MRPSGLYIHIPFCLKKCLYCDFYSTENVSPEYLDQYIDALLAELSLYSDSLISIKTIYIGGGTPSLLGPEQLKRLLSGIMKKIDLNRIKEFSIECNPGTVNREKLRIMKDAGIKRLSLGIQSFAQKELDILGRSHTTSDALSAIELVCSMSFDLSVDLIYGIPSQSIDSWIKNLSEAVRFSPAHISTYELTVEHGTPLKKMIDSGQLSKPGDSEIIRMYRTSIEFLNSSGYHHYEVSNFAISGKECLHNINYWRRGEYIGIGAGAHSFLDRARIENYELQRYIPHVLKGLFPYKKVVHLSDSDELTEYIMLGLRMKEGISLDKLSPSYRNTFLERAEPLIKEGLLIKEDNRIKPTANGFLLLNEIILRLIPPF